MPASTPGPWRWSRPPRSPADRSTTACSPRCWTCPRRRSTTGSASRSTIACCSSSPSPARFRFRHELLREVVEAELLPGSRRRLHERFARRLEARPDLADTSPVGAAADLAHHFAEAGLVVEAYTHSIRAAGESEAVHAYADAHRHLERALTLEPHLPPGADDELGRVSLRRRAADDADLGGDLARAMELTRAALAMVDPSADPVTAGLLHSRIGYLQWSLGDGATALDAHREAVRLVPPDPPTAERARVLASLGGALMGAGRWAESREVCEAAIACAVAADAPAEESRARNMLGSDLVALGAIDDGIAQLREACRLAEQTGPADIADRRLLQPRAEPRHRGPARRGPRWPPKPAARPRPRRASSGGSGRTSPP